MLTSGALMARVCHAHIHCTVLCCNHATQVEPIVDERKKLNVQIQAHLPQESFHTRNAITYIKTHEAVAKLRENLRAEHNVTIEFCAAVFKGVSANLFGESEQAGKLST